MKKFFVFIGAMLLVVIGSTMCADIFQEPYKGLFEYFEGRNKETKIVKVLTFVGCKEKFEVPAGYSQINVVVPQPLKKIGAASGDSGPETDTDSFICVIIWKGFMLSPVDNSPIHYGSSRHPVPYRAQWVDEKYIGVEVYIPPAELCYLLSEMGPDGCKWYYDDMFFIGFYQDIGGSKSKGDELFESTGKWWDLVYAVNPASPVKREPLSLVKFLKNYPVKVDGDWKADWDCRNLR